MRFAVSSRKPIPSQIAWASFWVEVEFRDRLRLIFKQMGLSDFCSMSKAQRLVNQRRYPCRGRVLTRLFSLRLYIGIWRLQGWAALITEGKFFFFPCLFYSVGDLASPPHMVLHSRMSGRQLPEGLPTMLGTPQKLSRRASEKRRSASFFKLLRCRKRLAQIDEVDSGTYSDYAIVAWGTNLYCWRGCFFTGGGGDLHNETRSTCNRRNLYNCASHHDPPLRNWSSGKMQGSRWQSCLGTQQLRWTACWQSRLGESGFAKQRATIVYDVYKELICLLICRSYAYPFFHLAIPVTDRWCPALVCTSVDSAWTTALVVERSWRFR